MCSDHERPHLRFLWWFPVLFVKVVITSLQAVITLRYEHKREEKGSDKAALPPAHPAFLCGSHFHSDSDKESSVSADFEVADASLALISLGRCSPGRTAGDLGEGKFSVSCILAGLCRR